MSDQIVPENLFDRLLAALKKVSEMPNGTQFLNDKLDRDFTIDQPCQFYDASGMVKRYIGEEVIGLKTIEITRETIPLGTGFEYGAKRMPEVVGNYSISLVLYERDVDLGGDFFSVDLRNDGAIKCIPGLAEHILSICDEIDDIEFEQVRTETKNMTETEQFLERYADNPLVGSW